MARNKIIQYVLLRSEVNGNGINTTRVVLLIGKQDMAILQPMAFMMANISTSVVESAWFVICSTTRASLCEEGCR